MSPKVLFVCVENSCRSQMAEGFARLHGDNVVEAWSAGSKPSGKINDTAVQVMKERGVDLTRQSSKGLPDLPKVKWDYVFTMGCGDACPTLPAKLREDWAIPDPKNLSTDEFRQVRDQIEKKILDLIREIKGAPHVDQTKEKVKEFVRDRYAKIAGGKKQSCCGTKEDSCCGTKEDSCCGSQNTETCCSDSKSLGYSVEELKDAPEGADLGLGCGNPQAIANLKAGEVVLDLGSGAGIDCFLAAKRVGAQGHVIGIDMTHEMLSKARENAKKGNFPNTEFRLGEIEHLPVADNSVDVIISNCVVNLSPDKPQVFKEAFRVLKSGGRLAISDVVATAALPEDAKKDLALYAGCMAGAVAIPELEAMLASAGFKDVRIQPKDSSREFIRDWAPGRKIEDYVVSANITGRKA